MHNPAHARTPQKSPRSVAVVGARGYAGSELVRLLAMHPGARITGLYASAAWDPAEALDLPALKGVTVRPASELTSQNHDVVFLATPAETSLELARALLARGTSVVDLSGAFRLQSGDASARYRKWYGAEHTALPELAQAIYGLAPYLAPTEDRGPWLVANPGCYATAVAMALIPLLRAGVVDPQSLVVDAKSGTTGAGRKAEESLLHAEVADDCAPYKVGGHQHLPEIIETCERFAGVTPDLAFTTHLLPVRRGILVSCYGKMRAGADLAAVREAYDAAYARNPLVKHAPMEKGRSPLLRLPRVVGTPRTHLAYAVEDGRLYAFCVLDNLLKGAASQAVENFNLRHGWPAALGLCPQGENP